LLNDGERDYSQIQNLLKQADGIAYNVQSMNQAFSQSYPVSISSATSDQQMIAGARQRWPDSPVAFQHALTRIHPVRTALFSGRDLGSMWP
jgi:P-type conjugative transfer protein TrbJ